MIKIYNLKQLKQRIGALGLAVLMTGAPALANGEGEVTPVNSDPSKIVTQTNLSEDQLNVYALLNVESILKETAVTGQIPAKYDGVIFNPTLMLAAYNRELGRNLNENFASLYADSDNFKYRSLLTMYSSDEKAREYSKGLDDRLTIILKNVKNYISFKEQYTEEQKQDFMNNYYNAVGNMIEYKNDNEVGLKEDARHGSYEHFVMLQLISNEVAGFNYPLLDDIVSGAGLGNNANVIAEINAIYDIATNSKRNCR